MALTVTHPGCAASSLPAHRNWKIVRRPILLPRAKNDSFQAAPGLTRAQVVKWFGKAAPLQMASGRARAYTAAHGPLDDFVQRTLLPALNEFAVPGPRTPDVLAAVKPHPTASEKSSSGFSSVSGGLPAAPPRKAEATQPPMQAVLDHVGGKKMRKKNVK